MDVTKKMRDMKGNRAMKRKKVDSAPVPEDCKPFVLVPLHVLQLVHLVDEKAYYVKAFLMFLAEHYDTLHRKHTHLPAEDNPSTSDKGFASSCGVSVKMAQRIRLSVERCGIIRKEGKPPKGYWCYSWCSKSEALELVANARNISAQRHNISTQRHFEISENGTNPDDKRVSDVGTVIAPERMDEEFKNPSAEESTKEGNPPSRSKVLGLFEEATEQSISGDKQKSRHFYICLDRVVRAFCEKNDCDKVMGLRVVEYMIRYRLPILHEILGLKCPVYSIGFFLGDSGQQILIDCHAALTREAEQQEQAEVKLDGDVRELEEVVRDVFEGELTAYQLRQHREPELVDPTPEELTAMWQSAKAAAVAPAFL